MGVGKCRLAVPDSKERSVEFEHIQKQTKKQKIKQHSKQNNTKQNKKREGKQKSKREREREREREIQKYLLLSFLPKTVFRPTPSCTACLPPWLFRSQRD